MKRITNRKEIINQISFLAKGEIDFVPVNNKNTVMGEIYCNRVEYGEFEVGFTIKNISEQNKTTINWSTISNLCVRICTLMNKSHYKPFRLESPEVRAFWFSKNQSLKT